MTRESWSNADADLLVTEGPASPPGNTVFVGHPTAPPVAYLAAGRRQAVQVQPAAGLGPDEVLIGSSLAAELSLGVAQRWTLTATESAPAGTIVLESMVDGSLDQLAAQLQRATGTVGQVCRLGVEAPPAWVHAGGLPFRVRAAYDAGGGPLHGLIRIDPQTRLELFAPALRTGVDVVVLVDGSGSMAVDDIPDAADSDRRVSRMRTLQRALARMVDERQRIRGRPAHLALGTFSTSVRWVFSETSDAPDLRRFRNAIAMLTPRPEPTDIGNALHQAADQLHRHGVPGNDRLIVLVSDGADGAPSGAETNGRLMSATADPVSFIADLNRSFGVKMQTIGVGDPAGFDAWAGSRRTAAEPSLRPDHRLLAELAAAAGGAIRSGGPDVLDGYFTDLGAGVTHAVGPPSAATPTLPHGTRRLLVPRHRRVPPALVQQCAELADTALLLRADLAATAPGPDRLLRVARPAVDRQTYDDWVGDVRHGFENWLDPASTVRSPAADAEGWVLMQIDVLTELVTTMRWDLLARPAGDAAAPAIEGYPG
ncbi:vWA domain-containing protein [Actinoplanes xinjiangensis]|uniref:von Willebrand factor type A domain-containing protein n=1 Tax=Actinoplanes xinjiangensis TaxID=512350 RepID=A0A316ENG3_9ACTN|nr:vWA domain-containing protein [Actinoplanes xinjiangensis]PWK33231.1 von Willebrand factor type A domain-containing protein [Actinoplanes xinjiangensis]GIF43530.1 hypothetical protein Axi01nite_78410 [Actinoplanes xinjiangensis]